MTPSNIDAYCLLRTALALFQQTPTALNAEQLAQVRAQAQNEYNIENKVLTAPEAAGVIVSEQALADAVRQIRERFDDEQCFIDTLAKNDLDPQTLQQALLRQCTVETVMERVGARADSVSDADIAIFYHLHPEKFQRPEQRSARHILITINADFPENSRTNAQQRIVEIAQKLTRKPHKFADLAMQHSECPTALQGGELGVFGKGHLYPEIDAVLFTLKEGQISDIIETEIGFHIVQCGKIYSSENLSLKKARPKIRQLMQERLRRKYQRTWLANLAHDACEQSANLEKAVL